MLPSLFTLSPDVSGRRAPFLSALVIPSGARNLHSRARFSLLFLVTSYQSPLTPFPLTLPPRAPPPPPAAWAEGGAPPPPPTARGGGKKKTTPRGGGGGAPPPPPSHPASEGVLTPEAACPFQFAFPRDQLRVTRHELRSSR